ncbi:MAG TPA: glycosyltransferase family 4 protein [Acidimicrobiales bacterium]|nr:glycosyltransferase family 4 protein [Acidimicrobiales bacterium]
MSHLLVTNDFPPKVGGIQAYLWELWRRLDPASFAVLTASSHPGAAAFDAEQAAAGFRIERSGGAVLLPTPAAARRVRALARDTGASLVVIDPALPLGLLGPALGGLPYAVVLHGAEVAAPGRLPASRQALAAVLRHARLAVCAGGYPAAEARRVAGARMAPVVEVPPGVDTARLRPLSAAERRAARAEFGLPAAGPLVLSVSRLVPRKGMDVLVEAAAALVPSFPTLAVAVAGSGRDRQRLEKRVAERGAPVRFLGQVPDEQLPRLYGAADVFVMACRDRWAGLEQEGFGMVFLEAAACGVAQVAGRSGGAQEAVAHGETGLVVDDPRDSGQVAAALRRLLTDDGLRRRMGRTARRRAEQGFAWDALAHRLAGALADVEG